MITFIKLIHTAIWALMAGASLYIFYAGITKTFNSILFVSIILLSLEALVLLFNKWTCPLTPLARKYSSDKRENFDIYLPIFLARYNKIIFGFIFVCGLLLVIFNWLKTSVV